MFGNLDTLSSIASPKVIDTIAKCIPVDRGEVVFTLFTQEGMEWRLELLLLQRVENFSSILSLEASQLRIYTRLGKNKYTTNCSSLQHK